MFILDKIELRNFGLVKFIVGKLEVILGVVNMIILVVLFIVIICIERKCINIGILICVVGVGFIIDFGVKVVLLFLVDFYNYFIRVLLVVFGCFIIVVGFLVLLVINVGVVLNDIVLFII